MCFDQDSVIDDFLSKSTAAGEFTVSADQELKAKVDVEFCFRLGISSSNQLLNAVFLSTRQEDIKAGLLFQEDSFFLSYERLEEGWCGILS